MFFVYKSKHIFFQTLSQETVADEYEHLKQYAFFFAVTCVFSFFKSFRANPKLNMVTETMRRSLPDLLHFAIVFLAIFLVFALCGMVIFGADVEQLSSYDTVFDACFQFCLGFLFDNVRDDMNEHNSGWLAKCGSSSSS